MRLPMKCSVPAMLFLNSRQIYPRQTLTSLQLSKSVSKTPSDTSVPSSANAMFPILSSELRVLSFNVAEFMPSQAAPSEWMPMQAFTAEILQHNPDVICLQEIPVGAEEFLFDSGYKCVGSCDSHCGRVGLLVKHEWAPYTQNLPCKAPAVIVSMSFKDKSLIFGSCHLAPYREGSQQRLLQMKEALHQIPKKKSFILAGDYNMRQNEDRIFERLGIRDAWKETGENARQKFTWDSVDRSPKGKPDLGPRNCYHGVDSFQFTSRFDRIYFRGDDLEAQNFQLIANKPLTSPFHYLSDHFGMLSIFEVSE